MGPIEAILALLATIYLWLSFWVSHVVVFIFQGIFALFFFWLPAKQFRKSISRFHFITVFLIITLNPFWWVRVHRRPKHLPTGGAIAMFNHICFADPWLVGQTLFPHFAYFASSEFVFKIPVLGWVMELTGHIRVKFETGEDGKTHVQNGGSLLRYSKKLLELGENLAVFPEGKLSHELKMLEFKLGYFRLAKETSKPIIPMAMWGNHTLYPPGDQYSVAHPGIAHIAIGDPVYPDEFETAELLCEHVRGVMIEMQKELPGFVNVDDTRDDSIATL